jgi:zinc transport system ATP-binding protein
VSAVIELTGGEVVLAGRRILHGVDLRVDAGETVALLGPNGSGKSTLVRAVVGLHKLADGSLLLFGVPAARFRDWRRIGYVPQRVTAASGVPATVREVVRSGRLPRLRRFRPSGPADEAAVSQALDAVGLAERARDSVADLSGGQQQRVLIARALAGEPDLLVLDEPLAGVDLDRQEAFAEILAAPAAAGTTVLLVAHELGPLEPLVDRAVTLRSGQVAAVGPPPPAAGHHAHPDHDHVHPHADPQHVPPILAPSPWSGPS